MLAKICADVLHYEINCHMIVSSMPWMDDETDRQTDGKLHFILTSFTICNFLATLNPTLTQNIVPTPNSLKLGSRIRLIFAHATR